MPSFHPDLRAARFLPPIDVGPRLARLANRLPLPRSEPPTDLLVDDILVPGPAGAPEVPIRMYRPRTAPAVTPVLLWIHGGGMVFGTHVMDEASNIAFARTLGITVVSVRYRLAPEHPAPAAVDDCAAVLSWLHGNAGVLGIDPALVAIGGASAGGGIAAGLAQLVHDRGGIAPVLQLLVYPMLDDRTVLRTDLDTSMVRAWRPKSNRFGWTSYLGREPGSAEVPAYAAPARRDDLAGLPPAWIGVGTLDLFHPEDVAYAERLERAGVAVELEVVQGAFHGFDATFRDKPVSRRFWWSQCHALERALFPAR